MIHTNVGGLFLFKFLNKIFREVYQMQKREKLFYKVSEILEKNGGPLPLSKSEIYKAFQTKEIPYQIIGGVYLIPASYINNLPK